MGGINLHFGATNTGSSSIGTGKVENNGKDNKGVKNLPLWNSSKSIKNSGLLIVGSDGIMYSPNDYEELDGSQRRQVAQAMKSSCLSKAFPSSRGDNGMKEELVGIVWKPEIAVSNFDYGQHDRGHPARQRRHAGGGKFKWDAKTMKTNRKDADKLVSKVYRAVGIDPVGFRDCRLSKSGLGVIPKAFFWPASQRVVFG